MNKLPPEILQDIFLLLHQQEKVECMTVCRHWNQAMEDSVLFDTFYLYKKHQLDNFMLKHQQDPHQCKKIGRLIISMEFFQHSDLDTLLSIILDLRELHFYEIKDRHRPPFRNFTLPHPWYKTIKAIDKKPSSLLVYQILKGGLCPVLTKLSVCSCDDERRKKLISLLVNTPALKSLRFSLCGRFSLADLELLHANVPLLSSFEIRLSGIDSTAAPLSEVLPAAFITKLTMVSVHVLTISAYNNLQKYFSVKYPEVTEMMHDILVNEYGGLISFNTKTGFAYFIKEMAPYLTTLKLGNRAHVRHIISLLNSNNGRIKKFEFYLSEKHYELDDLVQSNNCRYIQSLSLRKILGDHFVEYLGSFPVLKELRLYCRSNSFGQQRVVINISRLLENIGGTLKILRLSEATLEFDSSFTQEFPGLKQLILKSSTLPNYGDQYISNLFPKLRMLTLDEITWDKSLLFFDGMNLDYLEFRYNFQSTDPRVVLKTTSNRKERLYTAKPVPIATYLWTSDPTLFPAVKTFPCDKSNSSSCITFVCSSVRNFF